METGRTAGVDAIVFGSMFRTGRATAKDRSSSATFVDVGGRPSARSFSRNASLSGEVFDVSDTTGANAGLQASGEFAVPRPTVNAMAAAPEPSTAGTAGTALNSDPMIGAVLSDESGPAARDTRPTETLNMARTTAGSNCVPEPRVSSSRAADIGSGFLYALAAVMTAKASATATIRALKAISSLRSPLG